MTKINIQSPGGILEDGNLRIKDGLPIDGTLQTVSDVAANDSALQISTDEVGVSKSATATTQDTAVIRSVDTNAGIAIVPNGTGAITAQVPDGTAAGGNARGAYAVDLQMGRANADQVNAAGYSVIAGGYGNKIATGANRSVIVGGSSNTILTEDSFILGSNNTASVGADTKVAIGQSNTVTANGVVIGTSNSVSSDYSVVSGGQSNTASTGTHATVVGGQGNVSSGQYSVSGGLNNTASGSRSTAFGFDNVVSSSYAFAGGRANDVSGESSAAFGEDVDITANYSFGVGRSNTVASQYSAVFGRGVKSYLYNSNIRGGEIFDSRGTCQATELVASKFDDLTTGGTTVLSLDGTGTTNLIIPDGNNRVWNVVSSWVAVVTGTSGTTTGINVGDVITQCNLFAFKKIGGTSSIVGSVTNVATHNDAGMASASMGYSAGASQELALTFTAPTFAGGGSVSLRIVNKLMLTEVAYA